MKQVVSISLGPKTADYELDTEFLGHEFSIKRVGTDGDLDRMLALLLEWDGKANAIGLGSMRFPN
ncbi:MAG: quinate 5-dehydrogenase, partial [Deltaproteobacteria bacterium]|nr:quinate 5-dehydrogenase [Deltaproteobacteria bacterium]